MTESIVDWDLAESLGRRLAGSADSGWITPEAAAAATKRAAGAVADYTGLESADPLPIGESVARDEWISVNLTMLRDGTEAFERGAGRQELPGPLGAIVRDVGGRIVAAEAGAVLGFAGQRVLGQYDVALIGPRRPPRLLFVAPNIVAVAERIGHGRELLDWIALHEVTHALQFGAASWLQPHLGQRIEALLASNDARGMASNLLRTAKSALARDPRELLHAARSIDPLRSLLGPEQAELLSGLQSAMSAIEGYADFVMDEAGAAAGLDSTSMRAAFDARRRTRGPLETLLARILGLELKLRQYREGRRFAEAVAGKGGIDALNLLWSGPEGLPAPGELAEPAAWLARMNDA